MSTIAVTRALISVYDKSGLIPFAQRLHDAGVQIVSTGSTAGTIAAAGIPVQEVAAVTGFPECLDGRVKTLHPAVHGGILADLRNDDHRRQLTDLGIEPFGLVVVNLYPFRETVASGADPDSCVEQIDIGGPAMIRAAAKNHESVAVVVSPADYDAVAVAIEAGGTDTATRRYLAAQAYRHTADYDIAVASWMTSVRAAEPADPAADAGAGVFPVWAGASWHRRAVLRYGENPHQAAALYGTPGGGGLAAADQLHGKAMSYNNYVDADAAVRAAHDHDAPTVAIIKHTNPCGIAVGATLAEAYAAALATDPVSAFGGVVAVNRTVDAATAEQIAQVFTEVVVAPAFDEDALAVLTRKKNIRLIRLPRAGSGPVEWRPVSGGLLMQAADRLDATGDDPASWRLAAGEPADDATLADLVFAWRACRAVKSNAILLARGGAAVGIGMGQVNRVDSAGLAVARAGADRAAGSVAASDAFFPVADGLQVLIDAGVRAVVQPGGSVRDEEVVAAAAAAGVSLYLTGTRHFFH